ncbi:expressed unknown protein [Seminavis robusta]|uniref:RING-type domain-containing protein n=1 Tax=Seminavis robusta TaxID=568900 RepID=A0A9N8E760_9STRA|nr:expressed unknown protein [Seminavis robusta]|eukprot:Sro567_g168050.1 n/a (963) ;mRNA; r:40558-43550
MPICSRCGVDQPDDAFSEESQPLCEYCYEIELEEEAAGGEITADNNQQQQQPDHEEEEEDIENQGVTTEEEAAPKKVIALSGAARLLDPHSLELKEDNNTTETAPPDISQLDDLVAAIEYRGYSHGFGLDSPEVLHFRLKQVLFDQENHVLFWLTRPLVQALLEGPTSDAWELRVVPLNLQTVMEGQSLLHWLVQWKLLQLQCGWRGHDDMVDLLIRAGAPVDATLANGCTPLFFAVNVSVYSTTTTTQPTVNPHETFLVTDDKSHNGKKKKKKKNKSSSSKQNKIRITALDVMVTEFVTPHPDVSWATLGLPSVEDYIECMLLLQQRGVQLSPHYPDATFFLGQYLQGVTQATKRLYYTRKIADFLFGQYLPDGIQEQVVLQKSEHATAPGSCSVCSAAIIDTKDADSSFPNQPLSCGHTLCRDCFASCVTKEEETDWDSLASRRRCPTCHNLLCMDILPPTTTTTTMVTAESSKPKKKMSLEERRRQALSRLSLEQLQFECEARNLVVAEKERKDHLIKSLVHDWQNFVLPQGDDEDNDDNDDDNAGSRLMAELTLSHTLVSADNYLWVAASRGSVMIPITVKGIPVFALVSTTAPYTVVSPRFVKSFGFEINHNLQVAVSKPLKFVRAQEDDERLNDNGDDKPVNHHMAPRRKVPRAMAAPQVHLKAVRDLSFTLGNKNDEDDDKTIEVSLPSAMQAYEPHSEGWPVGVILGLDFFQSAAWIQMSVDVDLEVCLGRTIALLTGNSAGSLLEFDLIEPRRADFIEQDLRYYARNGKVFWTPLWHVSLSNHDSCLSLGQYLKELLPNKDSRNNKHGERRQYVTECSWCTRQFPFVPKNKKRDLVDWLMSNPVDAGMIQCNLCCSEGRPTFYCDEKCRKKAQATHSNQFHGGVDVSKYDNDAKMQSSSTNLRWKLLILGTAVLAVLAATMLRPASQVIVRNEDVVEGEPIAASLPRGQGDDL